MNLRSLALLGLSLSLSACSNVKESRSETEPQANPRVDWASVPMDLHPQVEETFFKIDGMERLKVNLFSFDRDVEVSYRDDLATDTGLLRVFKVWKKSATWGELKVTNEGGTLKIDSHGTYQCQIQVTNGRITKLDGGCYVRLEILLPSGSRLEVHNAGKRVSRRFIAVDSATLVRTVDEAPWAEQKFAAIEDFLASHRETGGTPSLESAQLGEIIGEFTWKNDKLKALGILHGHVSDRSRLGAMIDARFGTLDRAEARKVAGI